MPATWFLAPDFTFTTDGPLRLGMVLPHWSQPTTVLADLCSSTIGEFNLPNVTTIVERNKAYDRNQSRSNGFDVWSKFEGFASASISTDYGKDISINYGITDHEIRLFSDPLMPETVAAIANIPAVRAQIESGMFGRRAIYVVTGLRIAMTSFRVTKSTGSNFAIELGGSGPLATVTPAELGGRVRHDRKTAITDSYDTAPGIVFAYRLNIIRPRRASLETGLFSHKSAFLTGTNGRNEEALVVAEATANEIEQDLEEEVRYDILTLGDDQLCLKLHSRE
jgi:hypothetical protein